MPPLNKILHDAIQGNIVNILESAPGIIVIQDKELNILWVNKAYREFTRLKEEEIIGKKCWVVWGLERQCRNCSVMSAIETGLPVEAEMSHKTQESWPESLGIWLLKAMPLRDGKGTIIGAIETATEVSKAKIEQENKLSEVEEKFRAIAENTIDAIIITDEDGRVTYWNPAAERIFGYSSSETIGKDVNEVVFPEEALDRAKKHFEVFSKTGSGPAVGKVTELTLKNKSGDKIPVEITVAPISNQGSYSAGLIIRDISESHRVKALNALYQATGAIIENFDFIKRVNTVIRTMVETFGLTVGFLGRAEKSGSVNILAVYPENFSSYRDKITIRWDESPEGQGITGRAIRTGSPQVSQNILDAPSFKPWKDMALKVGGIASAAAFPLIARGSAFGALNLYSNQIGFFTKKRIAEIQNFAHLAAAALENSRLYEENLSIIHKITALRNIDMAILGSLDLNVVTRVALDEIITQLKIDAAAILIFDPYTQVLEYLGAKGFNTKEIKEVRLSVSHGIPKQLVQERKIIHIVDISHVEEQECMRKEFLKKEGFVSYYAVPLVSKGKILGVLEIFNRTLHQGDPEWRYFLETLAGQTAIAIENARLIDGIFYKHSELINAYNQTVDGWGLALSLREEETAEHCRRVTEMTFKVAKAMGIKGEDLYYIRLGAMLHDIGKIGVPDSILLKPGKLTDDEWKIMKKHPEYAFQMLLPITYLRKALEIPYFHHEKWDGTGYPCGLKGNQIPLAARIFAVVDVWDALSSDRPYRKAWPKDKVIEYILSQSGKHFDPEVVDVFIKIISEDAGD